MDGTGVPMRAAALAGRAGKQPDGSAKTREVKLVTVWSAEGRAADGTPVRDAGSVTYSAAIESAAQHDTAAAPSAFAARVTREATRRGFARARRRVVLGDGAPWIWNLAEEHLPDAVQIVDRFHAKQHLADAGKAIYGAASDLARAWARARHEELDAGDLDAVLHALRVHAPPRGGGAPVRRLRRAQPPPHAVPGVSRRRLLYLDRRRGGRLQGGHRHALQARRHALDRGRRRRHHRAPLLLAQRPLRGLLGTARGPGGLTLTNLTCARPPTVTGPSS